MALRIVTDTVADLSAELRNQYGIEIVPLTVHFGPESFLDVVEMSSEAFWQKVATSSHHPKTAQPAPGDFLKVYQPIIDAGDEILSIHVSGRLSGTISSAGVAASMLPPGKVTLVDSKSASLGIGLMAIEAARRAKAGESAQQIADYLNELKERIHIFFTLDSLEFLQKNGRVGKAQALLGGLLGIKPILQVDRDGVIAPADKVRGKSKVLPRVLELMNERVPFGRRVRLGLLHTQEEAEANRWLEIFKEKYEVVEAYVAPIGPVVATNAGPGTVGVALFEA
jgi:DegV family protein with EDD domain